MDKATNVISIQKNRYAYITNITSSITFYNFIYNVINKDGEKVGRKHSTLSNTGSQLKEVGVMRTPSNAGFRYTKPQNKQI